VPNGGQFKFAGVEKVFEKVSEGWNASARGYRVAAREAGTKRPRSFKPWFTVERIS
jgi:hypothetical protein